jgi:hypothetical protein
VRCRTAGAPSFAGRAHCCPPPGPVRAAAWWSAARPGWARRRCWTPWTRPASRRSLDTLLPGIGLLPGSSATLADELAASPAADQLTAAAILERAAALTIHTGLRVSRLLVAARQAWQAGRPGWARALPSRASGADPGEVALPHGEMELRDGEPSVATHELTTPPHTRRTRPKPYC